MKEYFRHLTKTGVMFFINVAVECRTFTNFKSNLIDLNKQTTFLVAYDDDATIPFSLEREKIVNNE